MVYGPHEGDGEEREMLWNDMDRAMNRVGNGYRLCVLGDLNGYVGKRVRVGTTGVLGAPGENDNGRRIVKLSNEMGPYVCYTYFKHMMERR